MSIAERLKIQALRGIKWTTLSTIIVAVVQLMQLSILSHYLTPTDFGLMAIMMVVIGFSRAFMDMGISNAIIHRQEITHVQLSSLYWLNVASGFTLFVLVILIAPVVAIFYEEPRIAKLLIPLSFIFLIVAVGNQYRVLCQKNLQFNYMSIVEISAAIISLIVGVLLAIGGYEVYALIYAMLAQVSTSSLLFLIIGLQHHHRPALIYKHRELKGIISFGLFQMGEKSINYFNTQFDILLIGKLLGTDATGIYHIAKTLTMRVMSIINPIVTKVALPVFAKLQNEHVVLKKSYLKMINYLSLISFPIFAAMAILAEPIVNILFGPQWQEAIVILQILSIYMLLRSTGSPIGTLLLAKGRADLGFYWNLAMFFILPIVIYVGSTWGTAGVALSLVGFTVFLTVPGWYFLIRPLCEAGLWEYLRQIIQPLTLACIAVVATLPFIGLENQYLRIVTVILTGAMVYSFLLMRIKPDFIKVLKFRSAEK